jgi:hypothetical protein
MSNFSFTRLEHFYCQTETTFGVIPNSGGTASVGNSNFCRHIKFSPKPMVDLIRRPDKTGSRSQPIGLAGRADASYSLNMSVAPNGTAGTAPDCDPLMQAAFGQAGTATSGTATCTAATATSPVVATTSNTFANGDVVNATLGGVYIGTFLCTGVSSSAITLVGSIASQSTSLATATLSRVGYKYTLSDSIVTNSLWSFRTPSTLDQRVVSGATVQEYQLSIGRNVAEHTFSGEGLWMLSSNQFSTASTAQKCGLTSFPSEPSSPVSNGNFVVGFTGVIAIDGQTIATVQTLDVRAGFQSLLVKDTFGTYYPTGTQGDVRNVGVAIKLYEDDSTAYQTLVQIAEARTPVTVFAVTGTTPGSIMATVLNNVQLTPPDSQENIRYVSEFAESPASASSLSQHDELVSVFC